MTTATLPTPPSPSPAARDRAANDPAAVAPAPQRRPFTLPDGTSNVLTAWTAAPSAPVILIVPAMGVLARFYEPLAAALIARGFNVAVADLRGNGDSSVRPARGSDFGYRELLETDLPGVVRETRAAFKGSRVYLLGHSLGGQLGACYVAREPAAVDGLILVASCSVWWRGWDFPASLAILSSSQFFFLVAETLGYFPGKRLKFAGTEARRVLRDWAYTARSGRYRAGGSAHDYDALLSQVALPVLALSIGGDSYAPPKAVANLCAKMPRAQLARDHLSRTEMGLKGMSHFAWVKRPEMVAQRIAAWLAR